MFLYKYKIMNCQRKPKEQKQNEIALPDFKFIVLQKICLWKKIEQNKFISQELSNILQSYNTNKILIRLLKM